MLFRLAKQNDYRDIIDIFYEAKTYLKELTKTQWQSTPKEADFFVSIKKKHSYVVEMDGVIVAHASIIFNCVPKARIPIDSDFVGKAPFGSIHLVMVKEKYKGLGIVGKLFAFLEQNTLAKGIKWLRIDTHELNVPMQKAILKFGFKYIGVVIINNNQLRLGYEKYLEC